MNSPFLKPRRGLQDSGSTCRCLTVELLFPFIHGLNHAWTLRTEIEESISVPGWSEIVIRRINGFG